MIINDGVKNLPGSCVPLHSMFLEKNMEILMFGCRFQYEWTFKDYFQHLFISIILL